MHLSSISDGQTAFGDHGFVVEPGPFARLQDAWSAARVLVDRAAARRAPLAVVGDFVIPPLDGPPSRDFQTLHLDFGLPLAPVASADVACFTALHLAVHARPSDPTWAPTIGRE